MTQSILSLWLRYLPADLYRRCHPATPPEPLVLATRESGKDTIAACDARAEALGVRPGESLAAVQGRIGRLHLAPADPARTRRALLALAHWAERYTPFIALEGEDELLLDIGGSLTLFGSAAALAADLRARLPSWISAAAIAVARTPAAAHALARSPAAQHTPLIAGKDETSLLASLPLTALRLNPEIIAALHGFGFQRLGEVQALPRAELRRRFPAQLANELDRLEGTYPEPIPFLSPRPPRQAEARFPDPLPANPDALATAAQPLLTRLTAPLAARREGVRALACLGEGRNGITRWEVRLGRAEADPLRLTRLLTEAMHRQGIPEGVERLRLTLLRTQPLPPHQPALPSSDGQQEEMSEGLRLLLERLSQRFGEGTVTRVTHRPSQILEMSFRRLPALTPDAGTRPFPRRPYPLRLLPRPEPVEVIALLPDHPPAQFTWRGVRHRVRAAEGPERGGAEWWEEGTPGGVRDYFRLEDETGARFWLCREAQLTTSTPRWQWRLIGFD